MRSSFSARALKFLQCGRMLTVVYYWASASILETTAPSAGSRVVSCAHTGLANLAETPAPTLIKADPHLPDDCAHGGSAGKQASPAEVPLGDDTDQAGFAEVDLKVQSEQRATQELFYRFQKLSMQALQAADAVEPPEPPKSGKQTLPRRISHLWHPPSACQSTFGMASSTHQRLDAPYQCAVEGHAVQAVSRTELPRC